MFLYRLNGTAPTDKREKTKEISGKMLVCILHDIRRLSSASEAIVLVHSMNTKCVTYRTEIQRKSQRSFEKTIVFTLKNFLNC